MTVLNSFPVSGKVSKFLGHQSPKGEVELPFLVYISDTNDNHITDLCKGCLVVYNIDTYESIKLTRTWACRSRLATWKKQAR